MIPEFSSDYSEKQINIILVRKSKMTNYGSESVEKNSLIH